MEARARLFTFAPSRFLCVRSLSLSLIQANGLLYGIHSIWLLRFECACVTATANSLPSLPLRTVIAIRTEIVDLARQETKVSWACRLNSIYFSRNPNDSPLLPYHFSQSFILSVFFWFENERKKHHHHTQCVQLAFFLTITIVAR